MVTASSNSGAAHPAAAAIQQSSDRKVKVTVSDIDGIVRGKYLHRDKLLGAAEPYPAGRFGYCDVALGWNVILFRAAV